MWSGRARVLGIVAVLALFMRADGAGAIPYFNGPDGLGYDNAKGFEPRFEIEDESEFRAAGSRSLDDGSFEIRLEDRQLVRVEDDFFEVEVAWKIINRTGKRIDRVLLLPTGLGGPPDFPPYDDAEFRLKRARGDDRKFFPLAIFDDGQDVFHFAAISIRDFKPGSKGARERKFRYKVFGDLVEGETPAIGVSAVFDPQRFVVPEPSIGGLLVTGTVFLFLVSRRRG